MSVEIHRTAAAAAAAAAEDGGRRGGGKTELVARGKKGLNPVLVEIGIAIALSFAGFVVSQLRPRAAHTPSPHSPSRQTSSAAGADSETGGKDGRGSLQGEIRIQNGERALGKIVNGTSTTKVGLSPTSNSSGDEEGFLLPGFNDSVMKEFEVTSIDLETTPTTTRPGNPKAKKETAMEKEIASLRELVLSLRERERSHEIQLLDYHGAKEQEAAMRELENRLKISAMETKLYIVKMESLQADNRRLKAQLEDYSRATNELEAAREKIKLLEKKLKSDGEQVKDIMVSLKQRVSSLQYREQKNSENDAELEWKLRRLEELENEAAELRMANSRLAEENSDLAGNLESAQMTASSLLEGSEVEALEEVNCLRKANEKLMEEIEQLQTDRCADVEELVYLRWLNACLRYELRNCQPPPGKTFARDLSNCLSPKSEAKAKQLILEYANLGGDEKSFNLFELDSEYSSSSQASTGEPEDTSIDTSSSTRHSSSNNAKFLSKLKKLVLGKGKGNNRVSAVDKTPPSSGNSERRASFSTCSINDMIGRDSYDGTSCDIAEFAANQLALMEAQTIERQHGKDVFPQINSRLSLDIQMLRRLDLEEATEEKNILHRNKKLSLLDDILINCSRNNSIDQEDTNFPEKAEIKKLADALRSSRQTSKVDRRSASFRL